MAIYCRNCGGKIKGIDRKYKHGHFKKLCIRCYQDLLLKGKVEGDNWRQKIIQKCHAMNG